MTASNFAWGVFSEHSFEIRRKNRSDFLGVVPLKNLREIALDHSEQRCLVRRRFRPEDIVILLVLIVKHTVDENSRFPVLIAQLCLTLLT